MEVRTARSYAFLEVSSRESNPRCASKDSNLHSVALEATASAVGLDALIVGFQRRESRTHVSRRARDSRARTRCISKRRLRAREEPQKRRKPPRCETWAAFHGKTRENRLGVALHRGQTAALPIGLGARIQWNELRHARAEIIVGVSLSSTENENPLRNVSLRSGFETTCASGMSLGGTAAIASARNHIAPHVARRLLSAQP